MFGFGKKKEDEDKEKAAQEQISQAMRSMSDKIAEQAGMIKKLEDQLDDAQEKATSGGTAEQALAQAQAQLRTMKAEMIKMKADAAKAVGGAADAIGGAAGALGSAVAGRVGVTKIEPATHAAGTTLGGAAPSGGLAIGGTAYVQKAGGKNLRLRNAPGLDTDVLAGLPPGTQLSLLEGPIEDDGYPWWRIRTSDGREGWVAGTELVTQPE